MNKPLDGKKILITREKKRAASLVEKIKFLGGHPIVFSTMKINDPVDWAPCDRALKEINLYDWIVFPSANSVRCFMKRAKNNNFRAINSSIAVIGDKTEFELHKYGYKAKVKPSVFSASGLLSALENHPITGKHILIPSSNIARKELARELNRRGAKVNQVCFYRTIPNTAREGKVIKKFILADEIDFLTFFSPSAFNYFVHIMGKDFITEIKSKAVNIVALGPTTARAIQKKGLNVTIVPEKCDEESLIKSIKYFHS